MMGGTGSGWSVGALGCAESHYRLLHAIQDSSMNRVLILEDDVAWNRGGGWDVNGLLQAMQELPDDADIAFLGHCHARFNVGGAARGAWRRGGACCTHAYTISGEFFCFLFFFFICFLFFFCFLWCSPPPPSSLSRELVTWHACMPSASPRQAATSEGLLFGPTPAYCILCAGDCTGGVPSYPNLKGGSPVFTGGDSPVLWGLSSFVPAHSPASPSAQHPVQASCSASSTHWVHRLTR